MEGFCTDIKQIGCDHVDRFLELLDSSERPSDAVRMLMDKYTDICVHPYVIVELICLGYPKIDVLDIRSEIVDAFYPYDLHVMSHEGFDRLIEKAKK